MDTEILVNSCAIDGYLFDKLGKKTIVSYIRIMEPNLGLEEYYAIEWNPSRYSRQRQDR